MSLTYQRFDISTDTGGDFTDTGPPCVGAVVQILLKQGDTGQLDTGADFKLETVGTGLVIADYDNVGETSRQFSPRQATFDTGGSEIGDQFIFSANERLRLTVNQSAAVPGSKTATLYVWTDRRA